LIFFLVSRNSPRTPVSINMATTSSVQARHPPKVAYGEIASFAYDTFCSDKVRFALTALGMVVGTASLILVVTITMTGKKYVLDQIQGIGVNMIVVEYQGGDHGQDFLTIDDMNAVLRQVPGIVAASPVVPLADRIPIGLHQERDLDVLGVFPEYLTVRNLVVLSGRFFDGQDEQAHNKVGIITQKLAEQVYGSTDDAVGKVVKLSGLPFTIIGTFRERVDTFGRSEVTNNSMVIPYTVTRYFTNSPKVQQLYFSAAEPSIVIPVTGKIQKVIQSRHRPESAYFVQNLTEVVAMAERTANALTLVLLLIAAVTLLVSGIGIMNIMLATVSSRITEIGLRKAVGATNRDIRFQFLSEAIMISLIGGSAGVIFGLALPLSVRIFTEYRLPISVLSVVVAIVVSCSVGILFGTAPATFAAGLDPVESMRHE
jgi:putative ABC transport system permease protein